MQQIRIDSYTASPKAICRRWRRRCVVFFEIDFIEASLHFIYISGLFISCEMHADRHDRLKALWPRHLWYARAVRFARRIEDEHAQADERVAEEDCDCEEDEDEEDVDFLAEGAVCQGDGEV